jgi:2-oxoisovalerate dehydrogenase E2 component (dihydrolipoyl transacylase)
MMAAVREFTLPDLGEGLTESEIVRWLVRVGDVVAVDQPVVEVETAKAVFEVPSPYAGVVTACFGTEGESLAVGRPLMTVAVGTAPPSGGEAAGSGNVLVGYGTGAVSARSRQRARARGVRRASAPQAAGPESSGAPDVVGSTSSDGGEGIADRGPVAVISPLVRRVARENGVDLRALAGSGPDGLILRADVERAVASAAVARAARGSGKGSEASDVSDRPDALEMLPDVLPEVSEAPIASTAPGPSAASVPSVVAIPAGPVPEADVERVPLRGIRGTIAEKVSRSRREIPDATCWLDADATELLAVRAQMNGDGGPKVPVAALLARICTTALAQFPELNATIDVERGEIVRLPAVHLGFAAQTDRGLVVPVIRDAHARTTEGLAAEITRLTEAARAGQLKPGELTGGTITLNNYGVFGIDGSTPIINHPEAAMLGIGRIAAKPWVQQGALAVRQVVQLSLTFDHRVCDGGTAGGFLRFVADRVEQPALLLRGL